MNKEVIKNLFKFLKEFNSLKTKPLLDIDLYETVLWFDEIPEEKECYTITRFISSEKAPLFDKWIEVKKPKREPFPEPPKEIKPWLKLGTLSKHTKAPELLSHIIIQKPESHIIIQEPESQELEGDPGESDQYTKEEDKKVFLKDSPEVKKSFEDYMKQKWLPWSTEEKRLENVLKTYNSLYSIYKKNKTQGEIYEIKLGIGFLCSKTKNKKHIKRHIITAPVDINFNSVTGSIKVGPADEVSELSLEMDMLRESEKPKNCDKLDSDLSNLNNDFWKAEEFYNCLSSWLNSYDSQGQFRKVFQKSFISSESGDIPLLTLSPAIILRKRNDRAFIKFYESIIQDIDKDIDQDTDKESLKPCFKGLINTNQESKSKQSIQKETKSKSRLGEKHYFPLLANEEQKKIIEKSLYNDQVVVQGPPGTGKTHSIANLICHFLAKGKKILVTSQTDRALRVLRNKLPKELKSLCIEILGKDQKSFQELKKSFTYINSKYQERSDNNEDTNNINLLEAKDDQIKADLLKTKTRLLELKNQETKVYEKKFGFYTGNLALISSRLKEEEQKHLWITEFFNLKNLDECPLSNEESKNFFTIIKKLKNIDDSVLEESIEFLERIFTPKKLSEIINTETKALQTIEKHKTYKNKEQATHYKKLSDKELNQLHNITSSLQSKVQSLLNKNEEWVLKALNNCLTDKDRGWRHLYISTNNILDKNKETFQTAEEIKNILVPGSLKDDNDLKIKNLLKDFFDQYPSDDQSLWSFWPILKPKVVSKLKQIKIEGKNISSYEEVKKFQNYVTATNALKELNKLWSNQEVETNIQDLSLFFKNYHIFKDLLEPLEECLSVHDLTKEIEKILSPKNIPLPKWTKDSIKESMELTKYIQAKRTLSEKKEEFKQALAFLKPYESQKNKLAERIISSYEKRDLNSYKNIIDQIFVFKSQKQEFSRLCKIKNKLKNNSFYKKIKEDIENPVWEKRLMFFEEAWAWQRADKWLKEQTSEEFLRELNQKKEELLNRQKKNMEHLVSKKSWNHLLSNITEEELSSLKAWMLAISKIGKGTGITAGKHRKVAKKRMEECKTAIPAWIMPLYRVAENINPTNKPFDIAIIDEASQTGPDGFLLNYLAKKIIVVGDKEQISPENPGIKDEDVESLKKRYLTGIKFFDHIGREYSYYDYCETLFTGSHVQLREHFRCMPEIIQFSNNISYSDTPLIPLRQYGSSRLLPLKSTYVDGAISKVGSSKEPQNEKEAKAIVEQIKKCIEDPKYNGKTFGVIVLQGKSQIQIIEKALLEIDKTEIEKRSLHVGNAYSFQGDERDLIFLSMAVAKDWNTSALTKETYKKMYNVATSRAKDQMWLFHSVDLNNLSSSGYRSKLLSHCMSSTKPMTAWPHEELQKLYSKIKETKNKSPDNAPEIFGRPGESFGSWFETKVFLKIALKGYQVIPQYQVSAYRIDMLIVGSKGRLALECDGDYWHGGKENQTRDMERQWQLERCGWTFWRLRESAFNRDEDLALKNLWTKLDQMQIKPLLKE